MTKSPLGRTCRRPCTSETAVPSERAHQIRTGGAPATLHVTTVPESLRKCTLGRGSKRNRGPLRPDEAEESDEDEADKEELDELTELADDDDGNEGLEEMA